MRSSLTAEGTWRAALAQRIVAELQKEINSKEYGIGLTKFIEIRQRHTEETICPAMIELRRMYPDAGIHEMRSLLFHEHNMAVCITVCTCYIIHLQRKVNRLCRRRFRAAGVNDMWTVWHSNRNPQLILSYYLETVERLGFIQMITQSDPGTENFGIANAQTMLRQINDLTLTGFSQFRCRFAPGFEKLLDESVHEGWYNTHNTLQVMLFHWLFILWLQREVDNYVFRINNTQKRFDKHKILPHDIPELIHRCAADNGALNFKVTISQDAISCVRNLYIDPHNHLCYNELGRPPITRVSI
ncbi:hypothetical protein L210DRAFT_957937 [Boletus edulis BED1]|uniref:Uncharacterized protein n=1 Tax=Boletus edulis BED1 TaxID=1328754 RepID=A0AAD4BZG1_BOLED|nr:hypothetical protein L210DRAFT_957937 [Boletus edulis BED1]